MKLGIEEPDLDALVTTLAALAEHPEAFSPSAIAWTARTAHDALKEKHPPHRKILLSDCPGQVTIYDYPEAWTR